MLATRTANLASRDHTINLKLPCLHRAQQDIKRGWRRFNVAVCGRRFGKDVLDRDRAITAMLAGHPVGWWEPTYRSLLDNWKIIKGLLAPLTTQVSQQEHVIDLVTGGKLEMWSADNPDAGRGRRYKRAIINEAATVKDLEYTWNAVIRPTLMDFQGDAIFSGTPKGLNYFYHLFQMGDKDPDWSRWQYPTGSNPFIKHTEIEAAKKQLPAQFYKQEIEAEFLRDGAFFQGVDEAAVVQEPEQPVDHAGHYMAMGVDWALSEDWTVLTVACRNCNRVVDWERFNRIDFTYQRERLVAMAQRWNASVLAERNSIGEPNLEMLFDRVILLRGPDGKPGFNTSATTKPQLIQALALALSNEQFKIPADYGDEMRMYQVEMLTGGHPKFGAPQGAHDDRVISVALVWWALVNLSVSGGIFP